MKQQGTAKRDERKSWLRWGIGSQKKNFHSKRITNSRQ